MKTILAEMPILEGPCIVNSITICGRPLDFADYPLVLKEGEQIVIGSEANRVVVHFEPVIEIEGATLRAIMDEEIDP